MLRRAHQRRQHTAGPDGQLLQQRLRGFGLRARFGRPRTRWRSSSAAPATSSSRPHNAASGRLRRASIIFNEGQEGRHEVLNGTLGGPGVEIPVIGTTFAARPGALSWRRRRRHGSYLTTSTISETRNTVERDRARPRPAAPTASSSSGAHLDSRAGGSGHQRQRLWRQRRSSRSPRR